MKYIVITGGVISGLGKGISASSIGAILQNAGHVITMIKIDPYINVDAGTMSPYEHGEVYVLNDGSETDLDLGNYERFLNINLTEKHNITTGKVYQSVINDERKGNYLGQTVQVIPHITDKIQQFIHEAAHTQIQNVNPDVCIIEVGGTVGDIESLCFIEALRQMRYSNENDDMCFIHVSLVNKIGLGEEFKTKPTQNSVKDLRQLGITPDLMIIRSENFIDESSKKKLSLFCQVPQTHIIVNPNVNSIYEVPIVFNKQNIGKYISDKLSLSFEIPKLPLFNSYLQLNNKNLPLITIGIIGKYTKLTDSYLSIKNAIEHAAISKKCKINILWISSENVDLNIINTCDGVIIPGGSGNRGVEGMITVANYCRINNIPLLGICLGMHIICIEIARSIYGNNCNSAEFEPNADNLIVKIIDNNEKLGGSMKLGLHETFIKTRNISQKSLAFKIYDKISIKERHRHRYEINPKYIKSLSTKLFFSGNNNNSMDIVEDTDHKFYFGCQYHPEFLSTLLKPSPVFLALASACLVSDESFH